MFKVTNFPEIGWPGSVYFLLLLLRDGGFDHEIGFLGQFYPLGGVGTAIDIMAGMVDESRFLEFFERIWNGLVFFNKLFKVDGLVAELPEMMFRIVLIAVGKKMKETHQPFFTGFFGVFRNGPEYLFGRIAFEIP